MKKSMMRSGILAAILTSGVAGAEKECDWDGYSPPTSDLGQRYKRA